MMVLLLARYWCLSPCNVAPAKTNTMLEFKNASISKALQKPEMSASHCNAYSMMSGRFFFFFFEFIKISVPFLRKHID